MGCITGIVAKSFLIAFNVVVAVAALIVLTLASIVQSTLEGYGHDIPQDAHDVCIGLISASTFIICLGALGVVVSCCCGNKLFLYTYFVLGVILVVITLVFAGMGATDLKNEEYTTYIRTQMENDTKNYNFVAPGDYEASIDKIYTENQCCGVDYFSTSYPTGKLPAGCCKDTIDVQGTICKGTAESGKIYTQGCWEKFTDDVIDMAAATVNFAIFFGVLLFALLTSTCLCVKCTDAMPI
ncbi:23 kDa integral membrane protein [Hyalella azteca]|uniref:23 kDa integral membrane protein n=1 Tax=Hyalella azteca TaxID=294128 RepID=A0A8B7PFH4_HYAAZ|nr:23 kDa integral membrane protein [Hyalella azteca]